MAGRKIKFDEEDISEILVGDTAESCTNPQIWYGIKN
jgi:hypothetical protein